MDVCCIVLSRSDEKLWADSVPCYCYLRDIQDLLTGGKTPYERRFGEPFEGPIIPFGSLVEDHPISAEDQSRFRQFGGEVQPGIFLGCVMIAGRIWKGDSMIADLDDLENLDASEIQPQRLNAKEVLTPPKEGTFHFPKSQMEQKLFGRGHGVREPTLRRESIARSEDLSGEIQGESEGFNRQKHKMTLKDIVHIHGDRLH